jgi:hypothetical protein
VPQIGLLKNGSEEYEYYPLDQVPDKSHLAKNGFDMKSPRAIRAFGVDVDTARQVLYKKGIKFQYQGQAGPSENPKEDWLCKVDALIDSTIFRAVAKIAFNYLAYWEGRDFLLHQCFDTSRVFIRYGNKADYPLVVVDDNPILGDEQVEGSRRLGHIVTINWAADRTSIVSQVSLFNWARYGISLSKNFSGEHRSIRRGHFFNVKNGEILDLEAKSMGH